MKTFDELTAEEQARAADIHVSLVLDRLAFAGLRFRDNKLNNLVSELLDTPGTTLAPWFYSETIMGEPRLAKAVQGLAQRLARGALYAERGDREVVRGVIKYKGGKQCKQ